jgi:putative spermidine/putrescine transport system substrate-binding protein
MVPAYVHEYGVGNIVWSYNIGYNTQVFTGDNHPKSWADVYDVKKFPGKRTLNAGVSPNIEIALMADGVDPKNLYPLDVDRAFKKLDTIKRDVIFWETNSQSQQLFIDGEVACGTILNGRAYDAVKKGGKLAIEWNQNIQSIDYLVVPKGSKNRDVAMHLIDEMTLPENQAKVANLIAYAPTNQQAFSAIDPAIAPWLSTNPQNADKGFLVNAEYWRDNLKTLTERWELWKLS